MANLNDILDPILREVGHEHPEAGGELPGTEISEGLTMKLLADLSERRRAEDLILKGCMCGYAALFVVCIVSTIISCRYPGFAGPIAGGGSVGGMLWILRDAQRFWERKSAMDFLAAILPSLSPRERLKAISAYRNKI